MTINVKTFPNSTDPYVRTRASFNADAPYDEDTCRRYPHAAAARIAFLEDQVKTLKSAIEVAARGMTV